MLDNDAHYATFKIMEALDVGTQNLLWMMADNMNTKVKDHLQVFDLSDCNGQQRIIHTQLNSEYSKEVLFKSQLPITATVYILSDGDYCTMMLADEYQREEK